MNSVNAAAQALTGNPEEYVNRVSSINSGLEWDENDSNEPPGWYRCQIADHFPGGTSLIIYQPGVQERVNLHDISWHLASGNSKKYLPSLQIPPTVKVPRIRAKLGTTKYCSCQPHRCKSYADDLVSLISSDLKEHVSPLQEINDCCKQLDLHL